jgi:hypothetical protein
MRNQRSALVDGRITRIEEGPIRIQICTQIGTTAADACSAGNDPTQRRHPSRRCERQAGQGGSHPYQLATRCELPSSGSASIGDCLIICEQPGSLIHSPQS